MVLYNTLTRTKTEFSTLDGSDTVRVYSCGPTVYSYAHIGNLRAYVFMDTLRRALEMNGYKLRHVMNITDVGHLTDDGDNGEDKMEKASRQQKKTPWEIAAHYTEVFLRDIDSLNIQRPEIIAKATDNIPEMIEFVRDLVDKGIGYEISDGIYYDISKFPGYGMLSQLKLDDLKSGARVEVNEEKRNPADFALWKKAPKEHIMQWPSPWGMGYPGWHIECSAMGLKYLGQQFDIHTGGVDHIPVHHENEIAQGWAKNGCVPAVRWMHNEFVLVDGGKMSKSLGNTYTLAQLAEKGYEPLEYRYLCFNSHYRQKLNFTFAGMDGAKKSLAKLRKAVRQHKGASGEYDAERLAALKAEFTDSVNDDLNVPKALGAVWGMARLPGRNDAVYQAMMECDKILALDLGREEKAEEKPAEAAPDMSSDPLAAYVTEQIALRAEAKKAKNYAEADRIRNELAAKGVLLIDTAKGTIWMREGTLEN